jgi:UDP-glucose 4-epimerase
VKIAIFGASGFIGNNIVRYFSEKKVDFICFGRKKSPFPSSINYKSIDILDLDQVKGVMEDKDIVVHFAASSLLESLEKPIINMKTNIEATLNILETMKDKNEPKIIFASTIALFDKIYYDPIDELHPCAPKSSYGVSKLAAERYLMVYHKLHGINYLIFRFTNVYGPYQRFGIIPILLNKISKGQVFEIYGDGSASRDFVFVEDIPEFILSSINKPIQNEIINFGYGKSTSVNNLVFLAEKIMKKKANIVFRKSREEEIENFRVSIDRLKNRFENVPTTNLKEGLKKTYCWYLENIKND